MLFDSGYPATNEKLFKNYYLLELYRDTEDAIPTNIPESRGYGVVATCFVDANHGGDRKSHTGVLIFVNIAQIYWYSKSQTTVEASIFVAEFYAMNTPVEIIEAFRINFKEETAFHCLS